jgi:N-acetylmuramoyl-L-alanine amidase
MPEEEPVVSTFPARAEPVEQRPPLKIVHPPEGAAIPAVKSSFVFGWADRAGSLTVNGKPVPLYPGGGWLTMIPYSPGPMTIQAELRTETTTFATLRQITVANGGTPPERGRALAVEPSQDLTLYAGEIFAVEAKAAPGLEGYFELKGRKTHYPLRQTGGNSWASYRGACRVPADGALENAVVKITLAEKKGKKIAVEAPGRVTRLDREAPWVVEVSTDRAILCAGPANGQANRPGYLMFPPPGARLLVTGRRGNEWRVRLSANREAWIGRDDARELPENTPAPRAVVSAVSVGGAGRHTQVRAYLSPPVPFEVRPSDDARSVDVLFFGAVSDTDWIHYNDPDGAVRRVEWFQEETDVYRLRIHTRPGRWWGYDARYESGAFVLELRRPPPQAKSPSPLKDVTVVVDAGHSADRGAIGPTELLEKDANLAIARCLEKRLAQMGAKVVMIRNGNEDVKLYDRTRLAWEAGGDVLISVHNNALPEGGTPFERNGYGVYYFQPQSFELARRVHGAYGEIFGKGRKKTSKAAELRDDGLHYGNLALVRTPQMPAILTESAYIMHPREEELLRTEAFQCDCAEAMARGLMRYVRDVRLLDR